MRIDISKYPHVVAIREGKIKKELLDEDLLEMIKDFEYRVNRVNKSPTISESTLSSEKNGLSYSSKVILRAMYEWFTDEEADDNDSDKELIDVIKEEVKEQTETAKEQTDLPQKEPKKPINTQEQPVKEHSETAKEQNNGMSKNELALHTLFTSGKLVVSKEELKQNGFDCGFWSPLTPFGTDIIGSYKLEKGMYDELYNVIKVK